MTEAENSILRGKYHFPRFPIWQKQITVNFNVVLRPICHFKGHIEDRGVGISAPAPMFCRRCWKSWYTPIDFGAFMQTTTPNNAEQVTWVKAGGS
jgi:hypothetical protein